MGGEPNPRRIEQLIEPSPLAWALAHRHTIEGNPVLLTPSWARAFEQIIQNPYLDSPDGKKFARLSIDQTSDAEISEYFQLDHIKIRIKPSQLRGLMKGLMYFGSGQLSGFSLSYNVHEKIRVATQIAERADVAVQTVFVEEDLYADLVRETTTVDDYISREIASIETSLEIDTNILKKVLNLTAAFTGLQDKRLKQKMEATIEEKKPQIDERKKTLKQKSYRKLAAKVERFWGKEGVATLDGYIGRDM